MIRWLKNKMLGLAMATAKVEKNALNNYGNNLTDDTGTHQSVNKDSLFNSLMRGEVTKEVENLRWRYYKVLQEAERRDKRRVWDAATNSHVIHDTDESAISARLKKIKADPFDNYELKYVITNTENVNGWVTEGNKDFKWKIEFDYNINARFKLENFCKYVYVKDMGNGDRVCSLYFNKYHDNYSPTHTLFLGELQRMYESRQFNGIFDIKRIGWVTDNSDTGTYANRGFLYQIKGYDNIYEHNGHYVVKFIVESEFEDFDILDKYRVEDLDNKYKNNERRSNGTLRLE